MKNPNAITVIGIGILVFMGYRLLTMPGGTSLISVWPGGLHPVSMSLKVVPQSANSNDTAFAVEHAPTVNAQFLDHVLCTASSPACGTGQALYDLGVKYHIDPVYALAFFQHESTFGKYGVAAQNLGIGNIRCAGYSSCIGGYRAYTSWAAGYDGWYWLILYGYVQGTINQAIGKHVCPCTTVQEIVPVYAPPSENDTQGYIRAVTRAVTTWRQEAAA